MFIEMNVEDFRDIFGKAKAKEIEEQVMHTHGKSKNHY